MYKFYSITRLISRGKHTNCIGKNDTGDKIGGGGGTALTAGTKVWDVLM